uniref:transcription factor-like 5 protein n=1 Tax=Semicossyphus pulcher TaxID=241346 RepID=UPI0037E70AEA
MSCLSSSFKTSHVSPSVRELTCDSAGVSQCGCLTHDQGQMLGPGLSLMEMSEVEYSHFQHLIQSEMEIQAVPPGEPEARSSPATVILQDANGSTVTSPFTTTQAIDLSTSTDEHSLIMPGEKTPASYGEIPGFVLARVRGVDGPSEPRPNTSKCSQKRSRSAARVCLETRFNTMSADTPRQQDIQSAVLSNFLTILQQSAEAKEAAIHPQMHKWMKPDRANLYEVSNPFVGGVFNPVTNMCEQVISHIPHMVEPQHPSLIIPKSFSINFGPERVVKKAYSSSGSSSAEEQQLVNIENVLTSAASRKQGSTRSHQYKKGAKAAPGSAGGSGSSSRNKTQSHMSPSQRRERHNCKERERRKKIRLCCDELNVLVPFCNSDTDKVNTLQWTTAFLRYINNTYGDTFKEEFKRAFINKKGVILKASPSSVQDPMQRDVDETLSIPLAVEQ